MRVLVAEDDRRTADYLVRGLTESGHIVDCVDDGETALAMAIEGIYDALVVDRKLPGMDGVTLVGRLRRRDRRMLVLMLSGKSLIVEWIMRSSFRGCRRGRDSWRGAGTCCRATGRRCQSARSTRA